jgi:parvulin-like peptidyl-prolyl isomerase
VLARMLNEPLLHFVVLGALIFAVYALTNESAEAPEDADAYRIVVDRAALVDYLQHQARASEPTVFAARLDAMDAAERDALIAAYVREEALYREGLRMQLNAADYDIRAHIVQKVEFLLDGLVAAQGEPTDAELEAFYDARRAAYTQDAAYTFTHLFFDGRDGMDAARARAEALFAASPSRAVEDAAQHGDPFPFLQNYVDRTGSFVASNFSAAFVEQLNVLAPAERWQGPLQSLHGWHLVLLRARSEAVTPPFAQVRAQVRDDYRRAMLAGSRTDAEQRVIADYDVTIELE